MKKSGESEQQILIEITTGQADYVNSEYNQPTDDEMIVFTNCRPYPQGNIGCLNNSTCLTDGRIELCQ